MENSIVFVGDIDYSERLQNVKLESDLDGGSTSSIFGSVLRETVTVIIYDEIEHADTLTLKFEVDGEIKDYGVFKVDKIEYDDKTTLTTVEAYSDISDLLEEFEMPNAKSTDELLEKLGLPKAPINYPIKDTSDKYYENKLKLLQDIAALTGSYVKVSPKVEFVQPSKPENLIKNGWDDFKAYGSGKNYVENCDFEGDMSVWGGYEKTKDNTVIVTRNWDFRQNGLNIPEGKYIVRIKYRSLDEDGKHRLRLDFSGDHSASPRISFSEWVEGKGWNVVDWVVTMESDSPNAHAIFLSGLGTSQSKSRFEIDWIQITPIENQHLVVEKTPLGNGLTRIQTWGGKEKIKLSQKTLVPALNKSFSMWVNNLSDNPMVVRDGASQGVVKVGSNQNVYVQFTSTSTYGFRVLSNDSSDNLDFIASDPIIYEDDGSMIYDIEEYDDKYRVRTMNSHSKTKMKFPIKKSVFKNEQYTHSLYVENKGNNDVLFKSEEGLYLENPVVEIKPDEQGTYSYTGTVSQDGLYTNFELATKEVEDELDLILAKPAVRYGDKPFEWPPEEEIVPLRLPTHMPFWITADDSIKYISNNSIGDTLAKITVFGPIKNPTLYIGSNTYRVYEELLENERIEIDQRAKTVIKVTSSGDRVNVFHLRDKEHSIFKPIPEGENTVTQNDDFSYTIILYHERNEPQWT